MKRRTELILAGLTLAILAPPHATTRGQAMVNTGHALDSNLRIGSGGYNGGVSSGSLGAGMGAVNDVGGPRGVFGGYGYGGGFGRGDYNRGFRGGRYGVSRNAIDYRNAFYTERGYNPNRFSAGYDTQAHIAPAAGTQTARPVTPQDSTSTNAFGAGFDSGYEAGLASAQYESEQTRLQAEQLAYGIGFALGEEIRAGIEQDQADVDLETLVAGFRNGIQAMQPQIPMDEMEALLETMHREITQRTAEQLLATDPDFRTTVEQNLASSRLFHADFGKEDGVVTLDSGVQYRILRPGDGPQPGLVDTVVVNYRLVDRLGNPRTEKQNHVVDLDHAVEGVQVILTTMKVGAKWEIAIPPEMAFGLAGYPPDIGPNESVIGEVELVEIR